MEKILVLGGARSGKSTFAENWVRALADPGPVIYVATSRPMPGDGEWADRVRRHQERRPSSWQTRETTDLAAVLRDTTGTVIIDCLTLWLTAILDDVGAWDEDDGQGRVPPQPTRPSTEHGRGPTARTSTASGIAKRSGHIDVSSALDDAVAELVDAWRSSSARVVAVSNEVGWSIVPATSSGRLFRDLLGTVNQRLSAEADRVVLCVAGRTLDLPDPPVPGDAGERGKITEGQVATASGDVSPLPAENAPARRATAESAGSSSGTIRRGPEPGVPAEVDREIEQYAREMVDGLAKPIGSLGRLEEIGVWLAGRQGVCPPRSPARAAVTVIAGDHGVAAETSAYPPAVTGAMVRTVHTERAAINALAAAHGATVRVRDLGVDADLDDLSRTVGKHKICRGTGRIDTEDALSIDQARAAIAAGRALVAEELSSYGAHTRGDGGASDGVQRTQQPAELLVVGDLGIGNTTVAATLIGVIAGLEAEKVTGRGTGVDDAGLARKTAVVAAAIERARPVRDDPEALLATVGGADFGAMAGFLAGAAEHGIPVLLDGVVVTAAALVAELLTPGAAAWWLAGHRSVEPAHDAALDHLGLEPIVDLRMRLGEGTGALAALPTLQSAVAIYTRMAALADLDLG
ncbi:nicotinate-nucleotide--dimethylbenzimidazole phosphoribosyltransferase [Phytoactinopolyspora endophytica]|uniref:nicotinate-nucleotide--dimethylbenzimidazole phosphoribosyltransferase n=1 Tax=Phytoactinopolyspora endophytica TaxID=1642495 RepID=UPI00197BB8B1|nr:nicotinate-nucleotide--dimethylbenzimidazole phosphoribosyltransferase [Phytoactinopolyspora endophytica]